MRRESKKKKRIDDLTFVQPREDIEENNKQKERKSKRGELRLVKPKYQQRKKNHTENKMEAPPHCKWSLTNENSAFFAVLAHRLSTTTTENTHSFLKGKRNSV